MSVHIKAQARVRGFVLRLLLGSSIAFVSLQTAMAAPAAVNVQIKPQPLASALRELSAQTGLQVMFSPEVVGSKTSNGLQGQYTADQAFTALLKGSGLRSVVTSPGTIVVRAAAAVGDGAVQGAVLDARTGAPLQGAVVRLDDELQTTADHEGHYRFDRVGPGPHTLRFDYLGMSGQTAQVDVAGKASVRSDARLTPFRSGQGSEVSEILVQGARSAEAKALNIARAAPNKVDISSSDQIGNFPDENAAEVVRRLPGVSIITNRGEGRYVSIRGAAPTFVGYAVDGIDLPSQESDRSVALDTVPSEQLSYAEVLKTVTPDYDAEGIGGRVNLVTKSPFDYNRLYASASAAGGGSEQNPKTSGQGALTLSNVFGPDKQFGALFAASYTSYSRGLENVNAGDYTTLKAGGQSGFGAQTQTLEDHLFDRRRLGLTGRLEWRPDDSSRYHLAVRYNTFDLTEYRQRTEWDFNQPSQILGVDDGVVTDAIFNNHSMAKRWNFVETDQTDLNVEIGGDNEFGSDKLSYELAYARATESSVADELDFKGSGFSTEVTNADTLKPRFIPVGGNDQDNGANQKYNQSDVRFFNRPDELIVGRIDWSHQFDADGFDAVLKSGLKVRMRNKMYDTTRDRFTGVDGGTLLVSDPRVAGPAPSLDSLTGYDFGPGFTNSAIRGFVGDRSGFVLNPVQSFQDSLLSDFRVRENVFAGYTMLTTKIGRLTLIPGVRVEHTESRIGYYQDDDQGQPANDPSRYSFINQRRDYTDFFPGFTARFDQTPNLTYRFAITRTIARPAFDQLATAREVDQTDNLSNPALPVQIDQGNPDLKPVRSWNVDAGFDWSLSHLGSVSASVFYKRVSGAIYDQVTDTTYQGAPAKLSQPENANTAHIKGIEVAFTKQFDFLPGPLAGFGVFANATFVDSDVKVPSRPGETFRLFDQSNKLANVALTYEKYGLDARLAWNLQGGYLNSLESPGQDTYFLDRSTLDMHVKYNFTPRYSVFVEAQNLTDAPLKQIVGTSRSLSSNEYYGRFIMAGVSLSF